MAVLIATSIIVLMFSGAMMLASRRDIKNEVSVETSHKNYYYNMRSYNYHFYAYISS